MVKPIQWPLDTREKLEALTCDQLVHVAKSLDILGVKHRLKEWMPNLHRRDLDGQIIQQYGLHQNKQIDILYFLSNY